MTFLFQCLDLYQQAHTILENILSNKVNQKRYDLFFDESNKEDNITIVKRQTQLLVKQKHNKNINMGNSQRQRSGRFCSHPDISTNQVITHKMQVNGQLLYFQPKNETHTFGYLSQQYQKFTGNPLVLQNTQVNISKSLQIGAINKNRKLLKAMQKVIVDLQQKQTNQAVTKKSIEKSILPDKMLVRNPDQLSKTVTLRINDRGEITTITQYKIMKAKNTVLMSQVARFAQDITFQQREQIELYDHEGLYIDYKCISVFQRIENTLTILLYDQLSYFSQRSMMTFYQQGQFCQILLSQIQQEDTDSLEVATLNFKQKLIERSKSFILTKTAADGLNFYVIQLQQRNTSFKRQIYLHKYQLVINQKYDWIRAQILNEGMTIYGINKQFSTVPTLFQVISKKMIKLDSDEKFYRISSPKYLNLIIDGIIVHNEKTINIWCHEINQKVMRKYQMHAFLSDSFKQRFKGKEQCFYGGHKINKQQTFGDYYLKNNDIVYVVKEKNQLQTIDRFEELTVSVQQSQNLIANKTLHNMDKLYSYFDRFKSDYFGILKNKIIQFSKEQAQKLEGKGIVYIVAVRSGLAERMNFQENVIPKFELNKKLFQDKELYKEQLNQFQRIYFFYRKEINFLYEPLSKEKAFPLFLYTTDRIYKEMNQFLRNKITSQNEENKNYIPMIKQIMNSLELLQKYEGLCYRGVLNANLEAMFGTKQNNQTVCLNSFTSTSTEYKKAINFSNQKGVVMTIISKSGRDLSNLSKFSKEKEVLFPPFTNFLIKEYQEKTNPQTITLQEIPIAKSRCKNLLFWVDDNPIYNQWIAKYFSEISIQVIEVTSTKLMRAIIKKFFKIYKMLGKKMAVITDMARLQDGVMNQRAGFDLLDIMYDQNALTVKSFIYISPKYVEETKKLAHRKYFVGQYITVVGDKEMLKSSVKKHYEIA